MNKFNLVLGLAILAIITSCKKDPYVDLIDTWEIEGERGFVTFYADGTGESILPDYSLLEDTDIGYFANHCTNSDTTTFKWVVVEQKRDKGELELSFEDPDSSCTGSSYPKYNFYPGGNEVNFGKGFVTIDLHRVK